MLKKCVAILIMVIVISLLTACNSINFSKQETLEIENLTLKYPENINHEEIVSEYNKMNIFSYDDKNFLILKEEELSGVDRQQLTSQFLETNINKYGIDFLEKNYNHEFSGLTKIDKEQAYKIAYSNDRISVGYICFFDKADEPEKLYTIIYIFDNENKKIMEKIVESINLK